jgi:hypothetical protein
MSPNEREEIRALAVRLLGLTDEQARTVASPEVDEAADGNAMIPTSEVDDLWRASRIDVARRRVVQKHLGWLPNPDLCWRILLDLFDAEHRGIEESIKGACLAADAPTTTALRHLGILFDEGLIIRYDDPSDRRRVHLLLSRDSKTLITAILAEQLSAERETEGKRPQLRWGST